MSLQSAILSIGSELTLGQTLDTNSQWLARRLAELGLPCAEKTTVSDDQPAITHAIRRLSAAHRVLLVTGGLGPTADDLTRAALADALDSPLRLDDTSLAQIESFFQKRGRPTPPANHVQAMIPQAAHGIENTCGTAPGIAARLGDCDIYAMPGVPREMREMFDHTIRPRLETIEGRSVIIQRILRTFGAAEAELGQRIADLMQPGRNPSVGTTASEMIMSVHVTAQAPTAAEANRLADADVAEIYTRLGPIIFGQESQTLAHAVARLLTKQRKTIATAESCTGGLLAKMLTDVPGSSVYFLQGWVTYSNESKQRQLGIPADLLAAHGAVSREVAHAMAAATREKSGADYALSVTGIAGPTGGTPDKPVGLVYIGLATPTGVVTGAPTAGSLATSAGVQVHELRLGDHLTRDEIRDRTAKSALNLLRLHCLAS